MYCASVCNSGIATHCKSIGALELRAQAPLDACGFFCYSAMAEDFQIFTSLRYDRALLDIKATKGHDLGWNTTKPSPFYMLDYHRDRMLRAATHWGWTKAIETIQGAEGLARLESFLSANLSLEDATPKRVKILLTQDGKLSLEASPVAPTPLANLFPDQLPSPDDAAENQRTSLGLLRISPPYDIYLDDSITSRSAFTHYKTTKREMYDGARQRAGLKPTDAKEVLISHETTGQIMEGSLTTPYFWRGGRWVTPPVSSSFSKHDGSGGQDGTTRRWMLEKGLAVEQPVRVADVRDGEPIWLSNGVRGFVFGIIRLHVSS